MKRAALLAAAWIGVGLLAHAAPDLPAGMEPAGALQSARMAFDDALFGASAKLSRLYLEAVEDAPDTNRVEALSLLLQSLEEDGRGEDIPSVLRSFRGVVRLTGDEGFEPFWRAVAEYAAGNAAGALGDLSGFVERYPQSPLRPRVMVLQAWCLAETGEIEAAIALAMAFDSAHPNSPDADRNRLFLARRLAAAGRTEDASRVFARLAAPPLDSREAQMACFEWARMRVADGDYEHARQLLALLVEHEDTVVAARRAAALLLLGDIDVAQGSITAAVDHYAAALGIAVDPMRRKEAEIALGHALLKAGQAAEAAPHLKAFITAFPRDPRSESAQLALAQSLLDQGEDARAAEEFQYYLETYTNSAGLTAAYEGKGWGLFRAGRHAEAAAAFLQAFERQQDPLGRERCLTKAADAQFANLQFALAAETYSRVLDLAPESSRRAELMLQAAESLGRADQLDQADEWFNRVVAQFPGSRFADTAVLRMAENHAARRQWTAAVAHYTKVIDHSSNAVCRAAALHGRGQVHFNLARYADALTDFEAVVAEYPGSTEYEASFYKRSICLYWIGRERESVEIAREFIKRFPHSNHAPDATFWLAEQAYNRQDYAEAEAQFVRFAETYPSHRLADKAMLRAGLSAARRREFVRSVELLSRMIKSHPGSDELIDARFGQADALSQLGRFSEAILIFDEIINKDPNSSYAPLAWGRKGDCQFTLGSDDPRRYEESLVSYRNVVNHPMAAPDLVLQANYKIGRCLDKLGQRSEASQQYYLNVVQPFLDASADGTPMSAAAAIWFSRAAMDAAEIMASADDWRQAVKILERVADADVPASADARERLTRIRNEKWWLF